VLAEAEKALDIYHLPVLSTSTRRIQNSLKLMWLEYFRWVLGSEEAAEKTLEPHAPLPKLETLKAFFHYLAVSERSNLGIAGVIGWSYKTTQKNIAYIFAMVRCYYLFFGTGPTYSSCIKHRLKPHLRNTKNSLSFLSFHFFADAWSQAVDQCAKEDGIVHTHRKEKFLMRPVDHLTFLSALLDPKLNLESHFQVCENHYPYSQLMSFSRSN
jgi:hypothetical protein